MRSTLEEHAMPNIPNPSEPGQPGNRGRESESHPELDHVDRTRPESDLRSDEKPMTGRQPAHPGQPGRWHDDIGSRDQPGEG